MPLSPNIAFFPFKETLSNASLRPAGLLWSNIEEFPLSFPNLAIWLRHLQVTAVQYQGIDSPNARHDYLDWIQSIKDMNTKPSSLPLPPLLSSITLLGRQAIHQTVLVWGLTFYWLKHGRLPFIEKKWLARKG